MTEREMVNAYRMEILAVRGGVVPDCADDPLPMQVAKMQDAWQRVVPR